MKRPIVAILKTCPREVYKDILKLMQLSEIETALNPRCNDNLERQSVLALSVLISKYNTMAT